MSTAQVIFRRLYKITADLRPINELLHTINASVQLRLDVYSLITAEIIDFQLESHNSFNHKWK